MISLSQYPTISVIIPTFNSGKTIVRCLNSITKQDYPKEKIEIILVDGGSEDNTLELANKFGVEVVLTAPEKQNVEYNKSVGISKAKGKLLLLIDHDNIFPNSHVLSKMVKPFTEITDLVACETLHYHYDKKTSLLNRYIALFGVTDPVAYYLGKADRMSHHTSSYAKRYRPEKKDGYYLVQFNLKNLPTVGANGFLVNRKILIENAQVGVNSYFHIDVNVDLVKRGFNKYAFIEESILHLGADTSIFNFFKRRLKFMKQFFLQEEKISRRRYKLYQKEDSLKLLFFIIISATFIVPLIDGIRGYLKVRDVAWFLHPVMCFGFLVIYGYAMIEHKLKELPALLNNHEHIR